jgi:hypothetical protein
VTRRRVLAGALAGVLYLAAAFALRYTGRGRGRPLFDSFSPPAPYGWVNPPSELARGNVKPKSAQGSAALGANGSADLSVATGDGQAFISLNQGAIPAHPPDSKVDLDVTPEDASTLAAFPPGLRFEGNAYRVRLTYQPSSAPVVTIATPGTIALTASGVATEVLFSPDGKQPWQTLPTKAFGAQAGLSASFANAGFYVVAGQGKPYKLGGSSGLSLFAYAGLVVLVLGTVAVVGVIVRRGGSPGGGSRRPPAPRRPRR